MTEFEALVHSLGEHLVDYVGRDNLSRLSVHIDQQRLTATAEVCLRSDDFAVVMQAIERIGEVRMMFMNELSFDYVLAGPDDCRAERPADDRDLVFA